MHHVFWFWIFFLLLPLQITANLKQQKIHSIDWKSDIGLSRLKSKWLAWLWSFLEALWGKTCFFTNLGWCRRSSIFLLSTKGHFQFPETMYIPALMALSLNLQSVTVSWVSFSQCKTPLLLFLCHLSFSLRVATYSSLLLRTQVIILGEPSNLG